MSHNVEISSIINKHSNSICDKWIELIEKQIPILTDLFRKEDLNAKGKEIIYSLSTSFKQNNESNESSNDTVLPILEELSRELTIKNVTPTETALLIFNLKEAMLPAITIELANTPDKLLEVTLKINRTIDKLGLFTVETYILTKENLIKEQTRAILEMATPVVKIWDKIILLPLVGILDSTRAKQMMESLLGAIQLGLDLSGITTRANLADGLQLALLNTSQSVSFK